MFYLFFRVVILYNDLDEEKPKLVEHERIYAYPGYDDVYNHNDFALVKVKVNCI